MWLSQLELAALSFSSFYLIEADRVVTGAEEIADADARDVGPLAYREECDLTV
jgi:hypothetical protein